MGWGETVVAVAAELDNTTLNWVISWPYCMTLVHCFPLLRSACVFLTVLGLYFEYSYPSHFYNRVKSIEDPVDNKYMTKIK